MSRLIDADKFAKKFTGQYEFMKKLIAEQPAVDAVEVVRCKNCVSYGITTNNGKPRSYMCGSSLPNDYCSLDGGETMINLTWFESEEDLQKLTGLNHDELWDAGFDLDDWDFGFVADEKLNESAYDWGDFDCGYYYLIWALASNNFAFEPKHIEYNGKHYYMSYHS